MMENKEENLKKGKKKYLTIVGILTVIFIIVILLVILYKLGIINRHIIVKDSFNLSVNGNWIEREAEEKKWIYYKYINNEETENNEILERIESTLDRNDQDYASMPAMLVIKELSTSEVDSKDIDNLRIYRKDMEYSHDDPPSKYTDEITKTSKGYDTLNIKILYDEEPTKIEIVSYLLKEDKIILIDASSPNLLDESELKKVVTDVAKSVNFK